MKRVAIKGQPDFIRLSDARLKQYSETIQEMIFSYSQFPEEKKLLTKMWGEINNEKAERLSCDIKDFSENTHRESDAVLLNRSKTLKRVKRITI